MHLRKLRQLLTEASSSVLLFSSQQEHKQQLIENLASQTRRWLAERNLSQVVRYLQRIVEIEGQSVGKEKPWAAVLLGAQALLEQQPKPVIVEVPTPIQALTQEAETAISQAKEALIVPVPYLKSMREPSSPPTATLPRPTPGEKPTQARKKPRPSVLHGTKLGRPKADPSKKPSDPDKTPPPKRVPVNKGGPQAYPLLDGPTLARLNQLILTYGVGRVAVQLQMRADRLVRVAKGNKGLSPLQLSLLANYQPGKGLSLGQEFTPLNLLQVLIRCVTDKEYRKMTEAMLEQAGYLHKGDNK